RPPGHQPRTLRPVAVVLAVAGIVVLTQKRVSFGLVKEEPQTEQGRVIAHRRLLPHDRVPDARLLSPVNDPAEEVNQSERKLLPPGRAFPSGEHFFPVLTASRRDVVNRLVHRDRPPPAQTRRPALPPAACVRRPRSRSRAPFVPRR